MGSVLSFFTGLVMLAGGKAEGPMLVTSPTNGCPDLWQLMYRSAAAVYIIAGGVSVCDWSLVIPVPAS